MRRPVFRTLGAIAAVALVATVVGPIGPASAAPKAGYIVETSSAGATASKVSSLRAANVSVGHQFRHVFHGFSASLTDALDASNDFNQHVVVEGYARDTQRAIYASDWHSAIRSATVVGIAGGVLIVVSVAGLLLA